MCDAATFQIAASCATWSSLAQSWIGEGLLDRFGARVWLL